MYWGRSHLLSFTKKKNNNKKNNKTTKENSSQLDWYILNSLYPEASSSHYTLTCTYIAITLHVFKWRVCIYMSYSFLFLFLYIVFIKCLYEKCYDVIPAYVTCFWHVPVMKDTVACFKTSCTPLHAPPSTYLDFRYLCDFWWWRKHSLGLPNSWTCLQGSLTFVTSSETLRHEYSIEPSPLAPPPPPPPPPPLPLDTSLHVVLLAQNQSLF